MIGRGVVEFLRGRETGLSKPASPLVTDRACTEQFTVCLPRLMSSPHHFRVQHGGWTGVHQRLIARPRRTSPHCGHHSSDSRSSDPFHSSSPSSSPPTQHPGLSTAQSLSHNAKQFSRFCAPNNAVTLHSLFRPQQASNSSDGPLTHTRIRWCRDPIPALSTGAMPLEGIQYRSLPPEELQA